MFFGRVLSGSIMRHLAHGSYRHSSTCGFFLFHWTNGYLLAYETFLSCRPFYALHRWWCFRYPLHLRSIRSGRNLPIATTSLGHIRKSLPFHCRIGKTAKPKKPDQASTFVNRNIRQPTGQHPRQKVWFQYWESHLTFQHSYFARLSYVHQNPVRHNLASTPSLYPWCSAAWFKRKATPAFFKTIMTFPNDKLEIPDDFPVECGGLAAALTEST